MSLFGFGKKKEESAPACGCTEPPKEEPSCCCGGEERAPETKELCCGGETKGVCCIKVLGSGCKNCHALLESAQTAVKNLGLDIEVEYVTDLQKVMEYGVMSMPGLVINNQVVSMGKVLKPADIEKLLHKFGA